MQKIITQTNRISEDGKSFVKVADVKLETVDNGICSTLTLSTSGGDTSKYHAILVVEVEKIEVNRIGNIFGEDKGTGYAGNVWDKDGLCPSLTTMQGGTENL